MARDEPGEDNSDEYAVTVQQQRTKEARAEAGRLMWFSDMSFRLSNLKTTRVYLGTKVPTANAQLKLQYETLPMNCREIVGGVPFIPHVGLAVHCVAYERELKLVDPGPDATEAEVDEYKAGVADQRAEVLISFLPLVAMQKEWKNMSWLEIVKDFSAEETQATTYILAMFQVPDTGKKQTILTSNRCVLCALLCDLLCVVR
jgi:hypothetical protein